MIQSPGVFAPHVWTFAPYVFPHSPQNVAVEFSIDRLSLCTMPSMSNFCHIFGPGSGQR